MASVTTTRTPAELTQAVKRAIATIDALEQDLGVEAPALTPVMKRHTARYKRGGDKVIATIALLARAQGFELPGMALNEMGQQLAIAAALQALVSRLVALQTQLGNHIFSARADAWQTAMQYYALLQRMARRRPDVAIGLKSVKEFMSMHDPRGRKQPGGPTRPQQRAIKKAVKVLEQDPRTAGLLANPTKPGKSKK